MGDAGEQDRELQDSTTPVAEGFASPPEDPPTEESLVQPGDSDASNDVDDPPTTKPRPKWPFVIAALVVLGLGFGGYLSASAAQHAQAQQEALERAETHFDAAGRAFEGLQGVSDQMTKPGADFAELADQLNTESSAAIGVANRELDAVEQAIDTLDESQARTDYIRSIALTRDALSSFQMLISSAADIADFSVGVQEWQEVAGAGDKLQREAATALIKYRWDAARAKATSAMERYSEAKTLAEDLDAAYPGYGIDHFVKSTALAHAQAKEIVNLCNAVKANSQSKATKAGDAFTALRAQAEKVGPPDFQEDPNLLIGGMLQDLEKTTTLLSQAGSLHDRALQSLESK